MPTSRLVQPTQAELDVLRGLAEPGSTVSTVARELHISEAAAKARLRSLYRRLGVTNAVQAWARLQLDGFVLSNDR